MSPALAPSLLHHSANAGHCSRTAEETAAAASSRPADAQAAIAYTESLGSRQNVHYVEDSMRLRANLVASAHRYATSTLPAFAYTRMRGNTIESSYLLELTQIGINKKDHKS
jgi:hypothetical protein